MAGKLVLAGRKGLYWFQDGNDTTNFSNGTKLIDASNGAFLIPDMTLTGSFTVGDDVAADSMVLKARIATNTTAGSALTIGATYTYGEAQEYRYTVSSWAGTGNQFQGMYLRVQSDTDNASGVLRAAEIMGVANASAVTDLEGVFGEAYIKGDTAETIDTVYGVHAEISYDASRATAITTTEQAPVLSKILSGKMADYTKMHGYVLRAGDMDGGSRTFGSMFRLLDGAESGTSAFTDLLYTNMAATYFLNASADGKGGVDATIAGQVVGTINCVVKCRFASTDFYLYGYAGKPTA